MSHCLCYCLSSLSWLITVLDLRRTYAWHAGQPTFQHVPLYFFFVDSPFWIDGTQYPVGYHAFVGYVPTRYQVPVASTENADRDRTGTRRVNGDSIIKDNSIDKQTTRLRLGYARIATTERSTMSDGGGENDLTVHLSLTSAPSAARVTIQIAPDITAAQLMEAAATGSHIPLAKLKLIFRGRLIASSDKPVVSEYKIEDASVVHCMGKPQAPSLSASTASVPPAASAAAGASVSVASSPAPTPVVAPAVSTGPSQGAVAEALRTLQGSNSVTVYSTALQTVTKMVTNILEHATEDKYRKIRRSNAAVQRKLTGLTGGHALLLALGFVVQTVENDEYYVLVASADAWTHLVSSKAQIASALSQAQQQSRVSAPLPIATPVAPTMPGMGMPGMGGGMPGMPPHMDAAAQAHAANLMSDPQAMRSLIQ
eukprot:scaffold10995_cov40-Attheya_sp.AAC.1